ncbi:formylglycine-generating enzyme family protein [Polyangium spumosum]|uniref:SUMF1/EgtB/PvdO family nonheme iron enzyme n=1 Tax=Polyangium spumosum TaxID=889282 RepID=A0A6N7PFX9_9BACT|nr:SUMF1/EgtB/PvdO family nonheme iron enzyme [Polyangium spumosum]MRG90908.1 SUMF1/EgtB/PvdO family nonheme iron enzyme [Polyangium spumosum]
MRPATVVALALLVLAPSAGARGAPPRPEAPAAPAAEVNTRGGIVTLQIPAPEALLLREGTFTMGSSPSEVAHAQSLCALEPMGRECPEQVFADEYPPHEVYLSDVWIDRTEVTVARYRRCVAAGHCLEPPYASGAARFDRPELPVVMVTWNDAAAFCAWTGGRLPTEAEWERAARGTRGRRYPWGNLWNGSIVNHGKLSWDELDPTDGFLELAPVSSFPDGRTPDGFADMAGNVEEWVADYYAPRYQEGSVMNPRGPTQGEERVLRGGGYVHGRPFLRAASRQHDLPSMRRPWRGFRCARDA